MCKKSNRIIIVITTLFCIAVILFLVFFKIIIVSGQSMAPTLDDGAILLISKVNSEYLRDDIVVFEKDDTTMIKRVIGVPGDTIELKDKHVYRNNIRLNIDYDVNESVVIILNEEEYFVVGDNYGNSYDSRNYGSINKQSIIGKVL